MPVDKQQIDKQEREMVQIELYTENLDAYADIFVNALNFTLIEKKPVQQKRLVKLMAIQEPFEPCSNGLTTRHCIMMIKVLKINLNKALQ